LEHHPDNRNKHHHTYAHSIVEHHLAQMPYGLPPNAEQATLRSFRKDNAPDQKREAPLPLVENQRSRFLHLGVGLSRSAAGSSQLFS
jgi:hypothetical protein